MGVEVQRQISEHANHDDHRSRSTWLLGGLMVAFVGRVGVQLVQRTNEVGFLPPFEDWQSGAVPYSSLLMSQVIIIAIMSFIMIKALRGNFHLSPRMSRLIAALGVGYFGFMVGRMIAGQTVGVGHPWWDRPLPTTFHIVLASFVILTAWVGATNR